MRPCARSSCCLPPASRRTPDSTTSCFSVPISRARDGAGESEKAQAAHLANISSMAADGVCVAAGPLDCQPNIIGGVIIMKAPSLPEAQRIAGADPTGSGHRNTAEEHPDTPEGMGAYPLALFLRGAASGAHPITAHEELIARLRHEGKIAAAGRIENDPSMAALIVSKHSARRRSCTAERRSGSDRRRLTRRIPPLVERGTRATVVSAAS